MNPVNNLDISNELQKAPAYIQDGLNDIIRQNNDQKCPPENLGYEVLEKGKIGILEYALSLATKDLEKFSEKEQIQLSAGTIVGEIFLTPQGFKKSDFTKSLINLEKMLKEKGCKIIFALTAKCILDDYIGYEKIALDNKHVLDKYLINLYSDWLAGQKQDTKIRYITTFLKRLRRNLFRGGENIDEPSGLYFYYKIIKG